MKKLLVIIALHLATHVTGQNPIQILRTEVKNDSVCMEIKNVSNKTIRSFVFNAAGINRDNAVIDCFGRNGEIEFVYMEKLRPNKIVRFSWPCSTKDAIELYGPIELYGATFDNVDFSDGSAWFEKNQNKFSWRTKLKFQKIDVFVYRLQKLHPSWSVEECKAIERGNIWIGMTLDMLICERGLPTSKNPSNYGNGVQWQWCWDNQTPSCFYGGEDEIITAYN